MSNPRLKATCKHGVEISLGPSFNYIRCAKCDAEADAEKRAAPKPAMTTPTPSVEEARACAAEILKELEDCEHNSDARWRTKNWPSDIDKLARFVLSVTAPAAGRLTEEESSDVEFARGVVNGLGRTPLNSQTARNLLAIIDRLQGESKCR